MLGTFVIGRWVLGTRKQDFESAALSPGSYARYIFCLIEPLLTLLSPKFCLVCYQFLGFPNLTVFFRYLFSHCLSIKEIALELPLILNNGLHGNNNSNDNKNLTGFPRVSKCKHWELNFERVKWVVGS